MRLVPKEFSITSTSSTAPDVILTLPQAMGATVMNMTLYNGGTLSATVYILVQETDLDGNVVNSYVADELTLYPGQQVYVGLDNGLYDLPPGAKLSAYLSAATTVTGTVKYKPKP